MLKQVLSIVCAGLLLSGCAQTSPTISNQFKLTELPKRNGLLAIKVTCTLGSGSGYYLYDTVTKQELASNSFSFPTFSKHLMTFNCEDSIHSPTATQFHIMSLPSGHYVLHAWSALIDLLDTLQPDGTPLISVNVHPGVLNYAGQISLRGHGDTSKASSVNKLLFSEHDRYKLTVNTHGMSKDLRSIAKEWPNIPRSHMRLSPAKRLQVIEFNSKAPLPVNILKKLL